MLRPLSLLGLAMLTPALADAAVYENDFSGTVGSEWSSITTDTTPIGARRYLGQLGLGTVTLTLNGLPSSGVADISFDLFIINSWDGKRDDRISVTANGVTLLDSTFTNVDGFRQDYPQSIGNGDNPRYTGAAEHDTLGYDFYGNSVYAFNFAAIPVSGPTLTLAFTSSTLQNYGGITEESWGLDSVRVAVTPLPSGVLLLGTALVGLAVRARNA